MQRSHSRQLSPSSPSLRFRRRPKPPRWTASGLTGLRGQISRSPLACSRTSPASCRGDNVSTRQPALPPPSPGRTTIRRDRLSSWSAHLYGPDVWMLALQRLILLEAFEPEVFGLDIGV